MAETDTRFTLPDALRQRVEDAAREQATTPAELIEAAVASYLEERTWQRRVEGITARGRERAAAMGITEDDVDDLIHEHRRERAEQAGRVR